MFAGHLVRDQALLDYKNIDFTWSPRWWIGVNCNFGPKLVFDDCLNRKQAVLAYKIIYFT